MVDLKFGIIEEVDEVRVRFKVRLPDMDDMVTHWLPMNVTQSLSDKSYDLPDIGTQVSLLLDEHGLEGVILGAIYSEEDPPPVQDKNKFHKRFSDGTSIEYDKTLKKLVIDVQGAQPLQSFIEIKSNNLITIQADLGIVLDAPISTIKGNLKVMGSIS